MWCFSGFAWTVSWNAEQMCTGFLAEIPMFLRCERMRVAGISRCQVSRDTNHACMATQYGAESIQLHTSTECSVLTGKCKHTRASFCALGSQCFEFLLAFPFALIRMANGLPSASLQMDQNHGCTLAIRVNSSGCDRTCGLTA